MTLYTQLKSTCLHIKASKKDDPISDEGMKLQVLSATGNMYTNGGRSHREGCHDSGVDDDSGQVSYQPSYVNNVRIYFVQWESNIASNSISLWIKQNL